MTSRPTAAPLRTFFMEDHLESSRFTARFNLGESGSFPTTVRELLIGTGLSEAAAAASVLALSLRDSPNWGCDELRALVARLHPGSTPDDVLITTGTSEALFLLLHRLRPARTALAMPAFQLLYEIPQSLGSAIVPLPVRWDAAARPFVDEAEWLARIERDRPDCVIVNHPHNPSGLSLAPAFLDRLVDLAISRGATVIGDEHYRFVASDTAVLGPTVFRRSPRVFVTGSFIKCLGCPGLRIGWCVGDRHLLAQMQSDKNYTTHTVNPISELLSCRALSDLAAPIWDHHRTSWRTNRRQLSEFLAQSPAFLGVAPDGGFVTAVAWRGLRDRRRGEAGPAALRAAGVFVLPLDAMEVGAVPELAAGPFGDGGGFRLGLGARPDHFAQALREMERAAASATATQ